MGSTTITNLLQMTYWLSADVVEGMVMVMSMVVGIVQDGVMLMCMAEGVGVV